LPIPLLLFDHCYSTTSTAAVIIISPNLSIIILIIWIIVALNKWFIPFKHTYRHSKRTPAARSTFSWISCTGRVCSGCPHSWRGGTPDPDWARYHGGSRQWRCCSSAPRKPFERRSPSSNCRTPRRRLSSLPQSIPLTGWPRAHLGGKGQMSKEQKHVEVSKLVSFRSHAASSVSLW